MKSLRHSSELLQRYRRGRPQMPQCHTQFPPALSTGSHSAHRVLCAAQNLLRRVAAAGGGGSGGVNDKLALAETYGRATGSKDARPHRGMRRWRLCAEFMPSCARGDRTRFFLKVQDGCDYWCSYCTIPKARGRSRSGTIDQLVGQARQAGGGRGRTRNSDNRVSTSAISAKGA